MMQRIAFRRWGAIVGFCLLTALPQAVTAQPQPQTQPQPPAETEAQTLLLWPGVPPGGEAFTGPELTELRGPGNGWVTGVSRPTLTVYLPAPRTGRPTAAVMICPGGGYAGLAIDKEGHALARWLCTRGVAAAVLKYRHGVHPHPIPLQDAQRGLRLLRSRAAQWQLDPNQMGVAGFSAGGHLAATAGTRFDLGDSSASDPVERQSCRADFLVLIYPVISLQEEIAHRSSKKRILGPSFDPALVDALSNELQVSAATGPTFLVHASDDPSVPVEHSLRFYAALRQHQVPAELHLYDTGGHGFGMGRRDQPIDRWPDLLQPWMQAGKWMPAP